MAVKKLKKPTCRSNKQKWRPKLNNNIVDKNQESVPVKPKQKKTLVIAQELKFARTLAGNDKKARAKILKRLRSWLTVRSKSSFAFTEPDFMRLWKGLYYCMWLSDKPLIQEELAESISQLVHCFETFDVVLMYTTCALRTLSTEWYGIDQYRIDKFQMLVRRIIRQMFVTCKKQSWDEKWVIGISEVIETIMLDSKGSLGFKFHVTEVYLEELAKVSNGKISEDIITEILRPFAIYLATVTDGRQISHVSKFIFRYLIFQSDVGIEYMEKFKAWKRAGFPTGHIDAMQKIEVTNQKEKEEEEESENESNKNKPLDPRAGMVNVDLPLLSFNPQKISKLIQQYKFHSHSTKKNRQQIMRLINQFEELARGSMPIGIKEVKVPSAKSPDTNPKLAAKKLIEFQDNLYTDPSRHLNRKKKRKLLFKMNDDIVDIVENGPVVKNRKIESDNTEDHDGESEYDTTDGKFMQDKKPKASKGNLQVDKPKKISKKKELTLKSNETKMKKLRKTKECLKMDLIDGIDDFANFKSTATELSNKGKEKLNLKKSWEVSSTESSSAVTVSKKTKSASNLPASEAIKISDKVKNKLSKKKIIVEKIPCLAPVTHKLESKRLQTQNTEFNPKKRVKIMLQRNTAQATSEYFRQLRLSPAIPFDANKKPKASVLKRAPLSSPLNPFYKKL